MTATSERTCPSCRGVSPADAQFCSHCGIILPRSAASSGAVPRPADRPGGTPGGRPVLPRVVVLVAIVLIGVAVYRHQRRSSLIPVSGVPETTVTPPNEAEAPPPLSNPAPAKAPEAAAEQAAPPPPLPKPAPRSAAAPPAEEPERGTPRAGWYRVRESAPLFKEPRETSPVITVLKAGTKLHVTHALRGFLAVQSVTGKPPGYVSTDDVVPIAGESGGSAAE